MYGIWTLLTLPISWMTISRAHPDYSIVLQIVYLVREFFFSGSLGIYWYLLSLLYGCIIIYFLDRHRMLKIGVIAAVVLFAIGVILNCGIGWGSWYGKFTHIVFGSTRNPFNEGIFYMLVGFGISRHNIRIKPLFSVSLLILSAIIAYMLFLHTRIQLMQLFMAFSFFMLTIELEFTSISNSISLLIRQLSTALYLLQFPFILLFDFYLRRSTVIDYSVTLSFCIVTYILCKLILPPKVNKILYG